MLCFKPFILSLGYVCFFWALQSFSVLPVSWNPWSGMKGRVFFSLKESKYCVKNCQDREVGHVCKKGRTGCLWREIGVFRRPGRTLGKAGRMFSQIYKFENQVSCRHQCLWGGRDCAISPFSESVTAVSLSLFGKEESLFGNHCSGQAWLPLHMFQCARLFSFHVLSMNVFLPC